MMISPAVMSVMRRIRGAGGTPLLVGGFVRDMLLGLSPKDYDIEVHGMSAEALEAELSEEYRVDAVGASFGVLKVMGEEMDLDISLPRTESKTGRGHRGFMVSPDPWLRPEVACLRRDFTINAIAFDPFDRRFIDPAGGIDDLRRRRLRHTSSAFGEDPLRVLRGFQFVSRFELEPSPETLEACAVLIAEYPDLAKERVWSEWQKWLLKAMKPSLGLEFLRQTGWLSLYPELAVLEGCPQHPRWHPEGDVWAHTMLCVDKAADIAVREGLSHEDRSVLMLAALCHDMGKPSATRLEDGVWKSPCHAVKGGDPARAFMKSVGVPERIIGIVVPLVSEHMAHLGPQCERSVRRLAKRLEPASIEMLSLVIEADHSSRGELPGGMPGVVREMLDIARRLEVQSRAPEPFLLGRHLLEYLEPSPLMGQVLKEAYEAQLDGEFACVEDGLQWLRTRGFLEA